MSKSRNEPSLALTESAKNLDWQRKIAVALCSLGTLALLVAIFGGGAKHHPLAFLFASFGLITIGGVWYFWRTFSQSPPGIQNNNTMFHTVTSRGAIAWFIAIAMMTFYTLYYWFPEYLVNLTRMFDPVSQLLRNRDSDQWFMYGALYTIAVVVMGVRAIIKYRHTKYQIIRTSSTMFFQFVFAFTLPGILAAFKQPEMYLNYFWPLSYKDMWPGTVNNLMTHPGALSKFLLLWTATLSFIAVPILTYYFGKRWYCSWVCGCGALANTMGDEWRHLSDKRLGAWKFERYSVHGVLLIIVAVTGLLWVDSSMNNSILGEMSKDMKDWYGFFIGSIWAGVVGTGFYPLMGTRVWCRFGCPQAAILGIFQRFKSRFRITTNGAQCISCGNCSTYCEMGIDVRWYAQRQQNVIRASCVGCGMCSTVCPRGVLNLENGPEKNRFNGTWPLIEDKKALSVKSSNSSSKHA